MILKEVNEELKAKLYEAKTVDDFMKVCEENGVDVTREEAESLYKVSDKKLVLSDDDLELVAGGVSCKMTCDYCGTDFYSGDVDGRWVSDGCGGEALQRKCPNCQQWNPSQYN